MLNRRALVSGMAAGALAAPAFTAAAMDRRKLRILVLGGSRFIGPAVVSEALARGHEVTLFNRGVTQPWLFPGVERRIGNRYPEIDQGLGALDTGEWDLVIDVPAYFPRIVDEAAKRLSGRAAHYLMISSISLYADFRTVGIDETYPVRTLSGTFGERPELSEDWEFRTYGARKALCEDAMRSHFGDRSTALRCVGVMGGGLSDPSKWVWPARLATRQVAAAAGTGQDHIQVVDRRDIAAFAVRAGEEGLFGAYNLAGPRLTFAEALATTAQVVGSDCRIVWTGDAGRERLGGLPNAAPEARAPGFASISTDKARAAGFTHRPYADSVAADWRHFREHLPLDHDFHAAGFAPDPAVEAALLQEFG